MREQTAASYPDELRQIRKQLGLSQQAFGAQLGCHWVTVCRYETGSRPVPEVVIRLARTLCAPAKEYP